MGDTVAHLYFHSPCFDGLVSAVLLHDYLETLGYPGVATPSLSMTNSRRPAPS